jgi:Cu-Zn family superoxide dismutase
VRVAPILFAVVTIVGCATSGSSSGTSASTSESTSAGSASAVMRDQAGRELGTLTLSESGHGFITTGTLEHLSPGLHGIHIHTLGSCQGAFNSAGAHWNPTGRQHGFENPMGPHLGDMQNLIVAPDSSTEVAVSNRGGGVLRGVGGLLDGDGASIVVHAGQDDYRTDPSGNSGARVACGVLQ